MRCYGFLGVDVLRVFNGEFFLLFFFVFLCALPIFKGQNTHREGVLWGGGGGSDVSVVESEKQNHLHLSQREIHGSTLWGMRKHLPPNGKSGKSFSSKVPVGDT